MREIVRHKARGTTYEVLGEAEVQLSVPAMLPSRAGPDTRAFTPLREGDRFVIYRGKDDRLWARFPDEFRDGRFEDITPVRRWWPSEYADEIMPDGLFSPDEWITGRCAAGWIIGPKDHDERIDYGCEIVQPGGIVAFDWNEPRGKRDLTINPDGTWEVAGGEPGDWTHVWDTDDFENSDGDLRSFVANNIDRLALRPGDEQHVMEVAFSFWGQQHYRLTVVDRNSARFEPCDEADASSVDAGRADG